MTEPPRCYSWDDYLYPPNAVGAQVLRNKPGLTSFGEWFQAERRLTFLRQQELIAHPTLVARTFDAAHWKAIHHQLFQDMYEWAGQFRTVNIGKDRHGFAPANGLDSYAEEILAQVRAANMFAGRDRAGVVEGLMYTMQAINIIHPSREGNGRTQRILTEHIAGQAGFLLDWHRIRPEEQNFVMAQAFDGEIEPLHDALERAVLPVPMSGSLDESPSPTESSSPARAPSFWHFETTGAEVLNNSRTQAERPADQATPRHSATGIHQQHDHGL